jgi:hypothetical protein
MKASFAVLSVVLSASSAAAYIDPGTGGMIVGGAGGALWPILAAAAAAVCGLLLRFFGPIKAGVRGVWQRLSGRH